MTDKQKKKIPDFWLIFCQKSKKKIFVCQSNLDFKVSKEGSGPPEPVIKNIWPWAIHNWNYVRFCDLRFSPYFKITFELQPLIGKFIYYQKCLIFGLWDLLHRFFQNFVWEKQKSKLAIFWDALVDTYITYSTLQQPIMWRAQLLRMRGNFR